MVDRFVIANIKRLPMFANLPPAEIERLAAVAQVIRYEAGEYIFYQGYVSQGMYFFIDGQAVLRQQDSTNTLRNVGTINPGQYINEAALYQEIVESAYLQVASPAIVLFLPRQGFQAWRSGQAAAPQAPSSNPQQQPPPNQPSNERPPSNSHAPGGVRGSRPPPPHYQPVYEDPSGPTHQRIEPSSGPPPPKEETQTEESTPSPITAMFKSPVAAEERRFIGQRDGEIVRLMIRRHWWALFLRSWWAALLAIALLIVATFIEDNSARVIITILNVLVPIAMLVFFYLDWRDDWLILSNQRVLHIEQNRLTFSTEIIEIPIKSVQGVNADQPNNDVFSYVFSYGNVEVRSAGNLGNVAMSFIPNPDDVQSAVFAERNRVVSAELEEKQREDIGRVLDSKLSPGEEEADKTDFAPPINASTPRGPLAIRFVNEKGDTVCRKHWLIWMRKVTLPTIVMLAAVFMILAWLTVPSLNQIGLIVPLMTVPVFIASMIWFYFRDWDWRNDRYIISDTTLTLIRKRPFFQQDEDDQVTIDRIDNIATDRTGLIRKLLNFGDVNVSLLGDANPKKLKHVSNPNAVREEISRRRANLDKNKQEADLRRQREEVAEAVRQYHERYGGNDGSAPPNQNVEGDRESKDTNKYQPLRRDGPRPLNIPRTRQ